MAITRRKFIVRTLIGGTGLVLGAAYLGRNAIRRNLYEMAESPEMLSYMRIMPSGLSVFSSSGSNS